MQQPSGEDHGKRGSDKMLYLKNGYLIDPASDTEGYRDIMIKEGKVARILPQGASMETILNAEEGQEPVTEIDLQGQYVVPGLVDVHVHFRDPGFTYKEDICTGAKAAARGGFTSVVLMANTKPAVDNPQTLAYVLETGRKTGIHIHTCANVTKGLKGQELTDLEELSRLGAAGFTDDGIPLLDEELLRQALQRAAVLHRPVSLHEEDPSLIRNNGVNAGKAAEHFGIGGSPR